RRRERRRRERPAGNARPGTPNSLAASNAARSREMSQDRQTARATDAPDAELAARAGRGDTAAFEALMRRHNRTLFRTARAILRDDAEAEDALQEAYLHAYRALPGFRSEARLGTWLVRIVANEALMRL